MKFTLVSIVCITPYFFVVAKCLENNAIKPQCPCELQREGQLLLQSSISKPTKHKYKNPFSSPRSTPSRYDDMTPQEREEREERVNRFFARVMQMITFVGHADNYLTEKFSGLVKVMGRAMESEDEDYETENYNRLRRHH